MARNSADTAQQEMVDRIDPSQLFVAKMEGYERRFDVVKFCTFAK